MIGLLEYSYYSAIQPLLLNPLLLFLLVAWSIAWKGWALWRAAKNRHLTWYIVLLIVNTVGILEIIYIYGFSGYKAKKPAVVEKKKPAKK